MASPSYVPAAAAVSQGAGSLRRARPSDARDQLLLRCSAPEQLEGFLQRRVLMDPAALGLGVPESQTGDPVLDQAIDVAPGGVVDRAIDLDPAGLEATVELVTPLGRDLEVRPHPGLELK